MKRRSGKYEDPIEALQLFPHPHFSVPPITYFPLPHFSLKPKHLYFPFFKSEQKRA